MKTKQVIKKIYFEKYHPIYCDYLEKYLLTDIRKYLCSHNLTYNQIDLQDTKSELKVKLFEWIHKSEDKVIQSYPAFMRVFFKHRLYDYLDSVVKEKIQKQRFLVIERNRMECSKEKFGYFDPDYTGFKELCNLIYRKLNCLDKKSRGIFSLKVLAGYTFSEISKLFHLPESTVKSKYYKAIEQLKSVLDDSS